MIIKGLSVILTVMGKSLTQGNIWSSVWMMSWPMVVIMFGNFLLGLVDIYVAGRFSPDVQASVGFCMQVLFLLTVFVNSAGVGAVSLVSKAIGAGQTGRAVEIARHAMLFSLCLGLLLSILVFAFSIDILSLANFPEDTKALTVSMLRVYAFALCNNYVLLMANALFRASGAAKVSMYVMLTTNLLNIAIVYPLAFGVGSFKGIGPIGIAVALYLSTLCGAFISLIIFKTNRWRGFYSRALRFDWQEFKAIVSIGWPAGIMQIAWHSGTLALMGILGRLSEGKVTGLAALTNGLRLEAIIYLPAFALNMSASVLIGQNMGAGNLKRAIKTGWIITFTGVVIVTVLSLLLFFASPFLVSQLSEDEQVRSETLRYLYFNLPVEPLMAVAVILAGAMQGAGDTFGVMRIIVTCMWLIRVPLSWTMAIYLDMGAIGVWFSMMISMTMQGLLMARRFRRNRWLQS